MNFDNPKGIIELGNINLKCLIFNVDNAENFEILSTSIIPTKGIHNGVVVNLAKASSSIRSCISEAERKARVSLKNINVVFEQPDFLCTKFSKHIKINGSKIYKSDIDFLLKESKKQVVLNDDKQTIIHIFNYNYIVDGKKFLEEPIGVYADSLSHEMTFITMPKNNLKNIKQVFIDCDIEIERLISNTFALGAKLLNENLLKFGSILLDMGSEKTSLGLFKNFALIHSMTLPIGINHITKDISKVCSLSLDEAEVIKNNINFSFESKNLIFDENGFLKEIYFNDSSFRKISEDLVLSVVKARLEEIFKKIQKQIINTGIDLNSGASFFIAGGGTKLLNFEKYCSNFFESNIKKLGIVDRTNNQKNYEENLNSCLGAFKIIRDGWETEAIPERGNKNGVKIGFFAKIFGVNA